MDTGKLQQRTYLRYRATDFALYLLSLLLTGALLAPVLHHPALQLSLLCVLSYLAILFVRKHGATWDRKSLWTVVDGFARYPIVLARSWWLVRSRAFCAVAVFVGAIALERALRPLLQGTMWAEPFPWAWVVWTPFCAITAFRLTILAAHVREAARVREVLEASVLKDTLGRVSIYNHLVHAFVTGLVSHLCLLAPCVLFYSLTDPTYFREAALIGGTALWVGVVTAGKRLVAVQSSRVAYYRLFRQNHRIAHASRFYFTVLHGHHHDAVPCAAIGAAGGTGFLESADRSIAWLDFLGSIVLTQLRWLPTVVGDMVAHQYVPGVFPYSKIVVASRLHHVAHHFGSLYPIGMVMKAYADGQDLEEGYKTDNARVRWFLDQVEHYEGLDAKRREQFVALES